MCCDFYAKNDFVIQYSFTLKVQLFWGENIAFDFGV
jgi:hypothetical protein